MTTDETQQLAPLDPDSSALLSLPPKHQRFVYEYCLDLNATQAYIRAGYSENGAQQGSSRLLSNVVVQQAIAEVQEQRAERTEVTQDWVIDRLVAAHNQSLVQHNMPAAIRALELLGKHVGMFNDRIDMRVLHAQAADAAVVNGLDASDADEIERDTVDLLKSAGYRVR